MLVHGLIAPCGFVGPGLLVALQQRERIERPAALVLGAIGGPFAGAGILMGALYQSTTANIHSGYSFARAFEWVLFALGRATNHRLRRERVVLRRALRLSDHV